MTNALDLLNWLCERKTYDGVAIHRFVRERQIWYGMIQRCHNPGNSSYRWYGAKGVTVCERWRENFIYFLIDMGPRPSRKHSIDRIDPCGNYELANCCWATTIFGEQVASKAALSWIDLVRDDLEGTAYAFAAFDLCAASVGAPHTRQRLFWVADASEHGCEGVQRGAAPQVQKNGAPQALGSWHGSGHPFEQWQKLLAETRVDKMDDGVSSTVGVRPALRAYGNAIVPQVAAEFIAAYMECRP